MRTATLATRLLSPTDTTRHARRSGHILSTACRWLGRKQGGRLAAHVGIARARRLRCTRQDHPPAARTRNAAAAVVAMPELSHRWPWSGTRASSALWQPTRRVGHVPDRAKRGPLQVACRRAAHKTCFSLRSVPSSSITAPLHTCAVVRGACSAYPDFVRPSTICSPSRGLPISSCPACSVRNGRPLDSLCQARGSPCLIRNASYRGRRRVSTAHRPANFWRVRPNVIAREPQISMTNA